MISTVQAQAAPPPSLARMAGRGALVTLGFTIAVQVLLAAQGIILARLLGPGILGLYAIAIAGVGVGGVLKNTGLPQKLVQEREVDLYTAYRVALSLELMLVVGCGALVLGAAPLVAMAYHRPELWPVMSALAASLLATTLIELPAALSYRQMRFARRSLALAAAPVTGALCSVTAAVLGAGIWSLVIGDVSGLAAGAVVVGLAAPIHPGFSWERRVARRYIRFGWPFWTSGVLASASGWGSIVAVSALIGIPGVGIFELAQGWARQVLKVDSALADAVYPALCARPGATIATLRAFSLTNRLSMLFAAPAGIGLAVLASPGVVVLLGPRWQAATPLVAAAAIAVTLDAAGHNWHTFLAARGVTWPRFLSAALAATWTVVVLLPALAVFGLDGAAGAIVLMGVASLAVRQHFVSRLIAPVNLIRLVWRELGAACVSGGALILVRILGWSPHGVVGLAEQAAVFIAVFTAAAALSSRDILTLGIATLRRVEAGPGQAHAPAQTLLATTPPGDESAGTTGLGTGGLGTGELGTGELALVSFALPEPMAFPLLVAADPGGSTIWVTARDWPALGQLDITTGTWRWSSIAPFPHMATPDGSGGCWSALTRASSLVHIDGSGIIQIVDLPRSRELLGTAIAGAWLFAVDADHRVVWQLHLGTGQAAGHPRRAPLRVDLPTSMSRPDFAVRAPDGTVWIGDTESCVIAVLRPGTSRLGAEVGQLAGPHPCRVMVADARRGGVWLGGSAREVASLVAPDGEVLSTVELPAVPFGMALTPAGKLVAALRDIDTIAVADVAGMAAGLARQVVATTVRAANSGGGAVALYKLPEGSAPLGCAAVATRYAGDGSLTGQATIYAALSGRSEVAAISLPDRSR